MSNNEEHQSANTALDPEIKKQAAKLFDLIEQHIDENGADATSEDIRDEMGDFLKGSDGFRELNFGYELSKTKYERAQHSLEEATWYLKDEALSDLFEIIYHAEDVIKMIKSDDEVRLPALNLRLEHLEKNLPKLKTDVVWEWWSRSKEYRSEIEDLKQAS